MSASHSSTAPSAGANETILVFVHGAWHTPAFFEPIIAQLRDAGYEAECVALPTCDTLQQAENPGLDLQDDAEAVRKTLNRLIIEEGRRVLLMPHSYGGIPTTQAVTVDLSLKARAAAGERGGVVGVLYIASFLIAPQTSLETAIGGNPASFITIYGDGMTRVDEPGPIFYGDVDPDAQRFWSSKIVPQTRKPHCGILTQAAYKDIPLGYMICDNDKAVPSFVQEMMVEKTQSAAGIEIATYHLPTAHSPYLSAPELFIETMKSFLKTV